MKGIILLIIRIYQIFISPLFGANCRFSPSCSEYASVCMHRFPIHRAMWYSTRRVFRCHPWNSGGFDPVPDEPINLKE